MSLAYFHLAGEKSFVCQLGAVACLESWLHLRCFWLPDLVNVNFIHFVAPKFIGLFILADRLELNLLMWKVMFDWPTTELGQCRVWPLPMVGFFFTWCSCPEKRFGELQDARTPAVLSLSESKYFRNYSLNWNNVISSPLISRYVRLIFPQTIIVSLFCSTDSGWDNPFRPDGDLSREADEIVERIREGLPITGNGTVSSPVFDSVDAATAKSVSAAPPTAGNGTTKPATPGPVAVQRTVLPPGASEPEHVVLKKKPKCRCCVIQ